MRVPHPATLVAALTLLLLVATPAGALDAGVTLEGDDGQGVNVTVSSDLEELSDTVDETTDDTVETVNETSENVTDASLDDTLEDTVGTVNETGETLVNGTVEGSVDLESELTETVVVDPTVRLGTNDPLVGIGLEAGVTDGASERDDRHRESSDRESESGGSIPGGNAGAGVAIGGGATGLALLARRFGTTAAFSTGQLLEVAGTTLSSILATIREWSWRLLGLIGYRRFSDDDPLEHDARATLYEYIESSPGSYLSEISEETGVELQTARHHLRILEFEKLVESETINGRRRYVPIGTASPELEAALNDGATAAVLHALADEGPDSVTGLATTLERDPSTVSHHLERLEEAGLVERERDGRSIVNRLTDDVERALADRRVDDTRVDRAETRRTWVPESAD